MNKTILMILILPLLLPVASNADMLLYEFGGVLPNGASNHLLVQDGESFTASFLFDSSAIDEFAGPQFGQYQALSGNIEFSGGYFLELMLNAPALGIFDDAKFDGTLTDIVTVQDTAGSSFSVIVVTEDTNALSSDQLLGDGAGFSSSTSDPQLDGGIFQLLFNDGANGSILYEVGPGTTNTFFTVRSVPEPSSGFLFCVSVSLALTRRIR